MATIILSREGQNLATGQALLGRPYRPGWFQSSTLPDSVTVQNNGEARTEPLKPGTGANRKNQVLSAAIQVGGENVLVIVSAGWDPSRPSWNSTATVTPAKAATTCTNELVGCSKCGTLFHEVESDGAAPLCHDCRIGGGS